jgi:alpha-beta hydrolase superfamily lysophospholipase
MPQTGRTWERRDIEIVALDGVVLRGWHYAQSQPGEPVIVMSHGFGVTKEMALDLFAADFADAGFNCVAYDHRNLGESDGLPRQHVDPWRQVADARDAITYARNLPGLAGDRLGIWGTSYSGGHVLVLGATDRRVRAVVSQGATISGWRNSQRRSPGEAWDAMSRRFAEDRDATLRGEPLAMTRQNGEVTEEDIAYIPAPDEAIAAGNSSRTWVRAMAPECMVRWPNLLTLRSYELYRGYEPGTFISRIAPTPLLVVCAANDTTTPTDEILGAYGEAREPKRLELIPGGHCDLYTAHQKRASAAAVAFYRDYL